VSVVVLYGRPGCCLCDEARSVLQRVRARQPFELIEVDIERDDALLRAYLERIPVVTLDVEESILRDRLARVPRMIEEQSAAAGEDLAASAERLSLGVAARLSRYLQVLTQARKMGRETISSHELAEYTHVNSTQIRRDLSGFGKFGKRGVGYNVDSLLA
jgi:glutaredoxin